MAAVLLSHAQVGIAVIGTLVIVTVTMVIMLVLLACHHEALEHRKITKSTSLILIRELEMPFLPRSYMEPLHGLERRLSETFISLVCARTDGERAVNAVAWRDLHCVRCVSRRLTWSRVNQNHLSTLDFKGLEAVKWRGSSTLGARTRRDATNLQAL